MKFTAELVVRAYANGYFPMQDPHTGEVGWYKPDPRAVIPLENFHVSRSLKKTIRKKKFEVTFDTAFNEVMQACAARAETWIGNDIHRVYKELHRLAIAHSVEVWEGGLLVGGLYGLVLGGAFFAESKFHRSSDASKIALLRLVERMKARGFVLLEVQFLTPHLETLGAIEISIEEYDERLQKALGLEVTW